jgi:hypothetical protein
MATFVDHHAMPELSSELRAGISDRISSGSPDENGAKAVNVYMGHGEAFCVSEAPSPDAVVAAHLAAGIEITRDDVHEVTPLG